jgi:cyclic pyranopterin phosphate synthase
MGTEPLADAFGRVHRSLRLSVTDRCNLRCRYCMPEEDYRWVPRQDLLTFDELVDVVAVAVSLGVGKVRLTGGEPLLRSGLVELVGMLRGVDGITDLAMTTNGVLLGPRARELRAAGLGRVTVSLDTLRPERFEGLTRRDSHPAVVAGIEALTAAGFTGTKIDTVVMRGTNDDELPDLLDFASAHGAEIRFIEYMDVGGATAWRPELVVDRAEMLDVITDRLGRPVPLLPSAPATAERFRLPDGRTFGIVASTTRPFCATCTRSRLTADGMWYRCLYARTGTDLRSPLRAGADARRMAALMAAAWRDRRDQGAVDRLREPRRGVSVPVTLLRQDPHLEMHTRGG